MFRLPRDRLALPCAVSWLMRRLAGPKRPRLDAIKGWRHIRLRHG
jgi:hypothetical protein